MKLLEGESIVRRGVAERMTDFMVNHLSWINFLRIPSAPAITGWVKCRERQAIEGTHADHYRGRLSGSCTASNRSCLSKQKGVLGNQLPKERNLTNGKWEEEGPLSSHLVSLLWITPRCGFSLQVWFSFQSFLESFPSRPPAKQTYLLCDLLCFFEVHWEVMTSVITHCIPVFHIFLCFPSTSPHLHWPKLASHT